MYMLIAVIDNPAHLTAVLDGWSKAGVQGITILDSTGVHRVRERHCKEDAPLFLGFSRLLRTDRCSQNTLFAVVQDMETVQRAAEATEAAVGDLGDSNTGIVFALPVAAAWGLPKRRPAQEQ
jgi:nitrogen regulatory protein PII